MKTALVSSALILALLTGGCKQEPAGKPVARAQIGDVETPAPLDSATAPATPAASVASEVETACRSVIYENEPLTQCLAIPANNRIVTALSDSQGKIYGSLAAFARGRDASAIAFAMNGGGYDRSKKEPTGYFVEKAKRLHTLVSDTDGKESAGGVFYGSDGDWHIRTTSDFLANVTKRPEFGVQAGPMLVTHGKVNPALASDKADEIIQNAVGIDDNGRAYFVISNAPIALSRLARFFRNELKVTDAIALDGGASQLWSPATDRLDGGDPIGPIIIVEKRAPANAPTD